MRPNADDFIKFLAEGIAQDGHDTINLSVRSGVWRSWCVDCSVEVQGQGLIEVLNLMSKGLDYTTKPLSIQPGGLVEEAVRMGEPWESHLAITAPRAFPTWEVKYSGVGPGFRALTLEPAVQEAARYLEFLEEPDGV